MSAAVITNPPTIHQIIDMVKNIEKNPDKGGNNLYKSLEALMTIYIAWINRKSNQGWLASTNFFDNTEIEEYEQILTKILKHYTDVQQNIGQLSQLGREKMEGGGGEDIQGPDQVLRMMMNKMAQANDLSRNYAKQYGLLKYLTNSDQDPASNIRTTFPTPVGPIPLIIPPRLLIAAVYVSIEIMRVIVAAPMNPLRSNFLRQVLSLTMTVLDLLLGRWKQAILSFAGTIGPTAMFTGQALKVYLEIFNLLGPSMSENIIWAHWNAFKSAIIGFLLSSFQLFAPGPIRAEVDKSLRELLDKKLDDINEILTSYGLEPLNNKYRLSFTDINHIQTIFQDPRIICSIEMENLYENMRKSNSLYVVLQLIGFPTDDEYRNNFCKDKKGKTITTLLSEEAIRHPIKQNSSTSSDLSGQPQSQSQSQSQPQSQFPPIRE